jgi:hypothetical protein
MLELVLFEWRTSELLLLRCAWRCEVSDSMPLTIALFHFRTLREASKYAGKAHVIACGAA